jgi:hypothetical protein
MTYRKTKWTGDEISKLEPSLKTAVEAPPKPKKERYLDEETGKYKFRLKEVIRIRCPECNELFFKKRPKQIFCQDFCRIRNWQRVRRKELKIEKRDRIEKMWGR